MLHVVAYIRYTLDAIFCANEISLLPSGVSRVGALFTISSRYSDDIDLGLKSIVHGICIRVQYILRDSNIIRVPLLSPDADSMISLLMSIDVSKSALHP